MNNQGTAHAPLRVTELRSIIELQILGLLTHDRQPTEKLTHLISAQKTWESGLALSSEDCALLEECASIL